MLANVMQNLDALPMGAAPLLIDGFLKGALLLVVCSVAVLVLRRGSAALRHLIWTIGLSGVLIMPVLNAVLPDWRVLMPMPVIAKSAPVKGFDMVIQPASESDARALSALVEAAKPEETAAQLPASTLDGVSFKVSTTPQAKLDWRVAALFVWLGGFVLSLGSLLFSVLRVLGLQRGTRLVASGPCVDAVNRAARRIGLGRAPRVHMGDERMMPMVWGLFRPVLLLPAGAARWPSARLEAVLLHELAHVRRRDALTQVSAELARAIYWFNPLVWIAARQMYLERELACDDMVLNAGTRPSDYAGDLLDLVRSLRTSRATGMAAIAMARPSQIKVRLRAVLDDARSRGTLDRRVIVGASVVALGVIAPLAAARPREVEAKAAIPVLDQPAAQVHSGAQAPRARAAAAIASAPEVEAAGYSALGRSTYVSQSCVDPNARRNGTSISSNSDDEITTVKWVSGRCSGHVRMEGKVRFSGDLKGVQSISAGGLFQIDEDNGSIDRRLTIRPNGSRLAYDYRVDGKSTEYDRAGQEWFAEALLTLYRTTGIAADERVDYLLSTQGPQAVVAEVDMMRSDYTQRVYLQKLIERTNLTPALLQSALETAAREIDSDYELAQLLIAFAEKYDFNDQTRKMFIDATRTIESDYEQRRVLAKALQKGGLDSQDVTSMLKASTDISSDYERAQLLIGLTDKYKMDAAMRTAYLDAAKDINSDYEKRRVYENLVKQGAMSPADLASVLHYASGISSDYEKAQVLIGLNRFDLSDAALQQAYLKAAAGISSDYEHRRVLAALLEKDKLTPANLDIVLKSALDIGSDYELAQLLLQVANSYQLSSQQREVFMKALNSINSSYEYGRVASALLKKSN